MLQKFEKRGITSLTNAELKLLERKTKLYAENVTMGLVDKKNSRVKRKASKASMTIKTGGII